MKIKTLIRFSDLKEKTIREVGEEFEASEERVSELLALSSSPIVEVIESDAIKKDFKDPTEESKKDLEEESKEKLEEEIDKEPSKSKK